MHRFFLRPVNIETNDVLFPEDLSRQISLVLRLKPGAEVIVLDGKGSEYSVKLRDVSASNVTGDILSQKLTTSEPAIRVTLLLCLTQREKFEWILQKCTEIGVAAFIPVISSRSLVQGNREVAGKFERWQRILREASEQSHRGLIPELRSPLRFEDAVALPEFQSSCRLIPWEEEKSQGLHEALSGNQSANVTLAIGPEGGFSEGEIAIAKKAGYLPVTLGPRILRMETAAITAAALVLYERGEMNASSD
jgi:16S rRNA (uracil1498-N3)-methyltransferase